MDLRSPGNRYDLQGFAAFTSRQLLDAADQSGFAAMLRAGKRQGALTFYALADAYHHGFNPVDVGQLRNGDFYTLTASTSFQLNGGQPFGPFQRGNVGLNVRQQWTFEDRLDRGFNVGWNSRWTLRGFQTFFLSGGTTMSGYDPSQTRGLGPRLNPREVRWQSGFSTDDRKSWRLSADFNVNLDEYGGRRLGTGLGTRWNVSSRFTLSGNVRGDWEHTEVDWSSNETFRFGDKGWEIGTESSVPSSLEDHEFVRVQDQAAIAAILSGMAPYDGSGRYYIPVFGARNSRTLDTTIRSSFTFTRHLDFSFYGQLFLARARYDDFQLLRDKDTHVPFPGYPKGNEFARNRFQFNSVLRWEYRPGSTVFVVWSQGRSGDDRLDPLLPIPVRYAPIHAGRRHVRPLAAERVPDQDQLRLPELGPTRRHGQAGNVVARLRALGSTARVGRLSGPPRLVIASMSPMVEGAPQPERRRARRLPQPPAPRLGSPRPERRPWLAILRSLLWALFVRLHGRANDLVQDIEPEPQQPQALELGHRRARAR